MSLTMFGWPSSRPNRQQMLSQIIASSSEVPTTENKYQRPRRGIRIAPDYAEWASRDDDQEDRRSDE